MNNVSQQPYFFPRQFISIGVLLVLLSALLIFDVNKILNVFIFSWLFATLSSTFLPYLTKGMKNNYLMRFIRVSLFYFPLLLPAFFLKIPETTPNHYLGLVLALCISFGLLLSNWSELKSYFSTGNFLIKLPINRSEKIDALLKVFLTPTLEEFFYRLFFTFYMFEYFSWIGILMVSIMFVHLHFMNRWANLDFTKRSYWYQFISSILFSIIFVVTESFISCVIAHAIFNAPSLIMCVLRMKNQNQKQTTLFNDYD